MFRTFSRLQIFQRKLKETWVQWIAFLLHMHIIEIQLKVLYACQATARSILNIHWSKSNNLSSYLWQALGSNSYGSFQLTRGSISNLSRETSPQRMLQNGRWLAYIYRFRRQMHPSERDDHTGDPCHTAHADCDTNGWQACPISKIQITGENGAFDAGHDMMQGRVVNDECQLGVMLITGSITRLTLREKRQLFFKCGQGNPVKESHLVSYARKSESFIISLFNSNYPEWEASD